MIIGKRAMEEICSFVPITGYNIRVITKIVKQICVVTSTALTKKLKIGIVRQKLTSSEFISTFSMKR